MSRTLFFVFGLTLFSLGCTSEPAAEPDTTSADHDGMPPEDAQHDGEDPSGESAANGSQGDGFSISSDNTKVLFTGTKKSGDSHSGGFNSLAGSIGVDGDAITSVNVVIETESLFSDADKLTGHLKNEDFFSVKEFPELKFESTKVEGTGDVTITGNLTMHGETAEISFPATASVTDGAVTLSAKFKVDRTKFGMNYTGRPDDPINADVDIEISVGGE